MKKNSKKTTEPKEETTYPVTREEFFETLRKITRPVQKDKEAKAKK